MRASAFFETSAVVVASVIAAGFCCLMMLAISIMFWQQIVAPFFGLSGGCQ